MFSAAKEGIPFLGPRMDNKACGQSPNKYVLNFFTPNTIKLAIPSLCFSYGIVKLIFLSHPSYYVIYMLQHYRKSHEGNDQVLLDLTTLKP